MRDYALDPWYTWENRSQRDAGSAEKTIVIVLGSPICKRVESRLIR
jgi:hypothetical protein